MNRKQFLQGCLGGACACALTGFASSSSAVAAETPKAPEDWRFQFVKRRYAKLLELLEGRMDDGALDALLQDLGAFCASTSTLLGRHPGDVDGYIREFSAQAREEITYDRANRVIRIVGPERAECFCPLVSTQSTSRKVCNCSLGWQKHTYETLLGRKVRVELKESIVRGGTRCTFEVHVSDESVAA